MKKIISALLLASSFSSIASLQTVDLGGKSATQYSLSANGEYLVFTSDDSFVIEDTDNVRDIYRKNITTGVIDLISTDEEPYFSNSSITNDTPLISNDGRYIAFITKTSHDAEEIQAYSDDLYIKDTLTGAYEWISKPVPANEAGASGDVPIDKGELPEFSMTPDGRYIAFKAVYRILGSGGTGQHIFVKDRANNTISFVASTSSRPRVSNNGRYIAFHSGYAQSVSPIGIITGINTYVKDTETGTVELISHNTSGEYGNEPSSLASISPSGRHVFFQSRASDIVNDDTNGAIDIFMKDRETQIITRITSQLNGNEITIDGTGNAITHDGVNIYFEAKSLAIDPSNSASTQYFSIYKKNLTTGVIDLLSKKPDGNPGNSQSNQFYISEDGQTLYFKSYSNDLEPTNGQLSNIYTLSAPVSDCATQDEAIVLLCATLDTTTRKKKNNKVKRRFKHLYEEGSEILELCPELSLTAN
jgi:Tol biopolymer transport system component